MCTLLALNRGKYTSTKLVTLQIASPIQRCRLPVPSPSSESAFSVRVVRVRPDETVRRLAMIRVAGPSAPRCLRRGGATCPGRAQDGHCAQAVRLGLRARPPATHVGGGIVSFKFVIASRSESLRSRGFGPSALRRVGS